MPKIEHLLNDGSVAGVVHEINAMFHRGEIDRMILCFVRPDGSPGFAFAGTRDPIEELGLLELAKIQSLTTREVID